MALTSADVYAEVEGDSPEAIRIALSDCTELPLTEAAVELAEDHRSLSGCVLGQVIAGDLGVVGLIENPDERVAYLAEALLPLLGLVDADREDDLAALGGDRREVDLDLLVVALSPAGQVVTGVLD